mgnify:CR=1 FL=1
MNEDSRPLRGLDKVRVTTKDVLDHLHENRENHVNEYKDALVGYRKDLIKALKKELKKVEAGKDYQAVYMQAPENHEDDYDRSIQMLQMSQDAELELTEDEFRQYIMDEWSWSGRTAMSNAVYAASAKRK